MRALREELKKKDDESLRKEREYEAKIQEIEARLETRSRSYPGAEYPDRQLDEGLQLISPDAEVVLIAEAKKQRALASQSLEEEHDVEIGNPWHGSRRLRDVTFHHEHRTDDIDVEMSLNDADRQDAGTAQQELGGSPQPVVSF
jgi:hypothetical protein